MSEKPRAVILAAGCGRRMESELGGDPKCMLSFGEETLLERQFRILEERNRKMQHTCGCWVFERQALHPLGRVHHCQRKVRDDRQRL